MAYTLTAAAQAHDPPSFIAVNAGLYGPVAAGSDTSRSATAAPRDSDLTTHDLQQTLRAARRDAGEARALADEMRKRATEISDRLTANGSPNAPSPLPTSVATDMAAAGWPAVALLPAPPPLGLPHSSKAAFAAPAIAGETTAVITPPLPETADAAARSPETEDKAEGVSRRSPLPGLMGLGGDKRYVAEVPDEVGEIATSRAQPGSAAPAVPASKSDGVTADPQPSTPHSTTSAAEGHDAVAAATQANFPATPARQDRRDRSQRTPLQISKAAAAAYGFVPLSRPKEPQLRRPAGEHREEPAGPLPRPRAATTSSVSRALPQAEPISRAATARALSDASSRKIATVTNLRRAGDVPAKRPGAGSAEPQAEIESKGLIGWLKTLGKSFKMPAEIGAFGWSKE